MRVVVVGAGLGGLSAALHLRGAGHVVTVLERADRPGGLCTGWHVGGFRIDVGPTVLTLPDTIDAAFGAVGERRAEHLDLLPVAPSYRARFADGSELDVGPTPASTRAAIAALAGEPEALAWDRFQRWLVRLAAAETKPFIDTPMDSLRDMARPIALARVLRLGGLRRAAPLVARFFRDDRLRRVFSFQPLYAGVSPFRALALLCVITHMDSVLPVVYPRGGMAALPEALAAAAARAGVEIHYAADVARVEERAGRVAGVRLHDGETVAADHVVLNPDLAWAAAHLTPAPVPRRLARMRYSPSVVTVAVGTTTTFPGTVHHTVVFGGDYRGALERLEGGGAQDLGDPSVLISQASATDASVAPAGGSTLHLVLPAPNLDGTQHDADAAERALYDVAEKAGFKGLSGAVAHRRVTTPFDWLQQRHARGTPFAFAHTFTQSGPFRPRMRGPVPGLWYVGSGTTPGVGVPLALMSGRLVSELIAAEGN